MYVSTFVPVDSEVAFSDTVMAFKEEEDDEEELFVGIVAAVYVKRKSEKLSKKCMSQHP